MKRTQTASLYPWMKGLDKTSMPGAQAPTALTEAKNIIFTNRMSLKKRPGVKKIDYIGNNDGRTQAVIQFFATDGGAQKSEILRVRNGRIEVLRGNDNSFVDLGLQVSPTDTVVFERFANLLVLHFENTRPKTYLFGATSLGDLGVLTGHDVSPPTFSRTHDFRLWYGGRPSQPHRLFVSALNDPNDYSLNGGGFSMRINDGDGDPLGLTGISPSFRGDIYAFKLNASYRILRTGAGYGIRQISSEVGCVHHNTIVQSPNDVFFVSADAIHSLVNTDKFGDIEEYTVTYPIYEFFQNEINWGAYNKLVAIYDKPSNSYLLSYPSAGSSINDRVLGFNVLTKQFFQWETVLYPAMAKFFDVNRQRTMVASDDDGLGVLRDDVNTEFGRAINLRFTTGVLFPLRNPKSGVKFTKLWFMARPTSKSVKFKLSYWIDGDFIDTLELDTFGDGTTFEGVSGGKIGPGDTPAKIGSSKIGKNKDDMVISEIELRGNGNSIMFEIEQTPPDDDPDQSFEGYGLIYEIDYEEDSDNTIQI